MITIYIQESSNTNILNQENMNSKGDFVIEIKSLTFVKFLMIELKGIFLNHNFYVVVGKQRRTENA